MTFLEFIELFEVYKFLLTLNFTQVTCELKATLFDTYLNLKKTHLRSCLTQDNLESLFLIRFEGK